jgi:hypothetical protein
MGSLKEIDDLGFKYYFEFTLTPYGRDFEPGTRDKKEIVSVFRKLADQIGPRKVDWRYDPIIFTPQWTVESHLEHFYNLASSLAKSTSRVIVSFVDTYRHVQGFNGGTDKEIIPLAQGLSKIGAEFGLKIFTCAEKMDITAYGIEPGSCVDQKKIEEIIGSKILAVKDHGQRETCGCIESFDIGIYNTCSQGCAYCYATTNPKLAKSRDLVTNDAPMMVGLPPGEITIHPKKGKTQKIGQSLFSEP